MVLLSWTVYSKIEPAGFYPVTPALSWHSYTHPGLLEQLKRVRGCRCTCVCVRMWYKVAARSVYETNQSGAVYWSEVYLFLCFSVCTCGTIYCMCGCTSCIHTWVCVCDVCGLSILGVSAGHVRDDPGRSWGGLVRPSAWASPQSPRLAGLSFPFVILGQ